MIYIIAAIMLIGGAGGFVGYRLFKHQPIFPKRKKGITLLATTNAEPPKLVPFECPTCQKVCKNQLGFSSHLRSHKDKKILEVIIEPPEEVNLSGAINALLVVDKRRVFRPVHIELKPNKSYGRQWEYAPYNSVYFLERKEDNSIVPIIPPEILSDSPSELYEAVQTFDDVQEVFGWLNTGGDKLRIWMYVLIAGVAIFIMFMAMTYKKAGG
jgi:hypothetical protein